MRYIKYIVIHCSAVNDDNVDSIRQYHINVKHWDDIGYHYIITSDGIVHKGRDEDVIGAHVQGYNSRSIGICLTGGANCTKDWFSLNQLLSLFKLLNELQKKYITAEIKGHKEFPNVVKACPVLPINLIRETFESIKMILK